MRAFVYFWPCDAETGLAHSSGGVIAVVVIKRREKFVPGSV